MECKHITPASYHPQCNGAVERWKVHSSLKVSPYEVLFGIPPPQSRNLSGIGATLTGIDESRVENRAIAKAALENVWQQMLKQIKEGTKYYEFAAGDLVLVKRKANKKTKFDTIWEGPYMIQARVRQDTYQLQNQGRKVFKTFVNAARLKPYRFRGEHEMGIPKVLGV
jgi:hypothetical protein